MKLPPAAAASLGAVLLLAAGAATADDRCLTGPGSELGATGMGDFAEVQALRKAVDAACDCASFDKHSAYVKCARNVIRAAVRVGELRKECKGGRVREIFEESTCGFLGKRERVPCLETRDDGRIRCRVRGVERVACWPQRARRAESSGRPTPCQSRRA